ncbi:MAG: hypothetical protein V2A66_08055, partial [Pseudomonadota bacterium]
MAVINSHSSKRSLAIEIAVVTAALLVVARILMLLRGRSILGQSLFAIIAILFLYVPIAVLWLRKRPVDFLDRGSRQYWRSVLAFGAAALILFPPFLAAAHGWQIFAVGMHNFQAAPFPNLLNFALVQILLVALPEEFFFRGYFQSAANAIFPG